MKTFRFMAILFAAATFFTSCSDNDDRVPQIINEEEVITDVSLTFTNEAGETTAYTFTDPQYRDENYVAPMISLTSGETYQVETNFYNNSNPSDSESVNAEIIQEKDDHFITYAFNETDVELERTDTAESTDSNNVQIGLFTTWTAGEASSGEVIVRLIHDAIEKSTTDPNGTFTGGETDAEVSFGLEIQ